VFVLGKMLRMEKIRSVLMYHYVLSVNGWEAVGLRTSCVYISLIERVHRLWTVSLLHVSRFLQAT
jgi:hypothetical protein